MKRFLNDGTCIESETLPLVVRRQINVLAEGLGLGTVSDLLSGEAQLHN